MVIGKLCLTLALPLSIFSFITFILGKKRPDLLLNAKRSVHIATALVTLASLMLVLAFVNNNFEIEYVYAYSSKALPLIYKLTGLWAGLNGSLLFWAWLLVICASIVVATKKDDSARYVSATIQAVIIFFLLMLVFSANPFDLLSKIPMDGKGLNPLLQNVFMIFHPPALYLGYVGFTVPFAYAIAVLLEKDETITRSWLKEMRLWVIISWLFLTVGNFLGAMWAYVELGWGGFWAWDPVENAGILPWFTATAFLHSLIIQERRGMFKVWNLALLVLTFFLTIFGTFITRSGIIRSVHSFSDVTIGIYFLALLVLIAIFSVTLLITRRKKLRGSHSVETPFSREGAFYLNNVLLVFSMFVILWGTMLPLVREWIVGGKVEVGAAYFNRTMAPIGVLLLFLTGIGPEMSWRKARTGLIKREFLVPFCFGVVALVIAMMSGVKMWFPLAITAGAAFVLAAIFDEFIKSSRVVARRAGCGKLAGLMKLFIRAPRRYGGYVVHIGIVFLFIGLAGSSYQKEYSFDIAKGERKDAAGYEFELQDIRFNDSTEREGVVATVGVSKNGKSIGRLAPALFLYRNQPKPNAEVDLLIKPFRDVYLVLSSISKDEKEASFVLTINPLISFVWLGGIMMMVGTIIALLPVRRGKEKVSNEMEIDLALGRALREDFNA